jgi:DHA2 family multidrug resistance protein
MQRNTWVPAVSPATKKWLVAAAVMFSAIMEVLDTSVVNVSFPHIAGNLSASIDEATWVLSSYIVANAVVLPLTGWLSNYIGRKKLLMGVVIGFTVSSMLCGLAPTLPMLIFFRVLQGLTGGGLQPLSQSVLLEEFPPEEHGKAMSIWGLGIVAAPLLGPTLGGWLTESYSWRWIFYINVPIGIVSLAMIWFFVQDPAYLKRSKAKIDGIGLSLLVVSMGSLQITLDKGQQLDWFGSNLIRVMAFTAFTTLVAFIWRELVVEDPIVQLRLFKSRNFAAGVGAMFILSAVMYGSMVLLPLFMQELLGYSPINAGLASSPRGLTMAAAMFLIGMLLSKGIDARKLIIAGALGVSWAMFGYTRMSLDSSWLTILPYQLIQGFGTALVFIPLTTLTMFGIAKEKMPYATSLYSVTRNIGSSIGVSFVTTFLARHAQTNQAQVSSHMGALATANKLKALEHMFMLKGTDLHAAHRQAMTVIYHQLVEQSTMLSYGQAYWIFAICFLGIIPVALLMKKKVVPKARSQAELAEDEELALVH